MSYIIENYDKKITPDIIEYALKVEDKFLLRRAVYLLEKVEKKSVQRVIEKMELDEKDQKKLTTALKGNKEDHNFYFPEPGAQFNYLDVLLEEK